MTLILDQLQIIDSVNTVLIFYKFEFLHIP